MFDEPAANLHAKAQAELLTSFSKLVATGNRIVYSTHSHHMINPKWLSGAYIVENTALDYDSGDAFDLSTKPTHIVATKYRAFVSQHPSRTSYFQPVIEKLEYVTPEIIGSAPFVIVEGVSDYYALKLAAAFSPTKLPYSLMPGSGAGASGPVVSLLLGRGEKFLILLDDDKSGKLAAKKYLEEWYLPAETALTLGELDAGYKGKKLESLFSVDTLNLIKTTYGLKRTPHKKEIGLYLAERCAIGSNQPHPFSTQTRATFEKILQLLANKVS